MNDNIKKYSIKVLYVCSSPTFYGDNIALLNIMPVLMSMGVEPFFLVQREGEFTKVLSDRGYKYSVVKFTYNNLYSKKSPIKSYCVHAIKAFLWNMRKKEYIEKAINSLETFRPDIIHSNNSANAFGLYLSKKLNVPHVWHIREYMDLDHNKGFFPSKRHFEKVVDTKNNSCIFITPDVADHFKISHKKRIIYDGVINKSPETLDVCSKENTIIYVGRLLETKGVYDIVTAFGEYAKNNIATTLSFIGDGENAVKSKILAIASQYGIEDRVKLLGYKNNVFYYMKKARAIIVSSRFEAFGFITAEAMNNGCLVIGKNTAGTKLQLDMACRYSGQEVGIRFMDTNSLVDAMHSLSAISDENYDIMIRGAYSSVQHFFTIEDSAADVINLYRELKFE